MVTGRILMPRRARQTRMLRRRLPPLLPRIRTRQPIPTQLLRPPLPAPILCRQQARVFLEQQQQLLVRTRFLLPRLTQQQLPLQTPTAQRHRRPLLPLILTQSAALRRLLR